ncbi:MAG TPA: ACT domain-containing protein [Micromonosporaceae bacterium]|nr:ACT domain-containing protein [Micromonosporaceae bacterium]
MNEYAVTVIGHDRPGIIADATEILARLGLNLTDSTMTRLRGHFAMTLICAGEPAPTEVEAALEPLTGSGSLVVTVRRVAPETAAPHGGTHHVLTVHGADRLGIVAALARTVADAGGNVTDLTTRLAGEFYLVVADIDLPSTVDVDRLADRLRQAADRLGVEATLRPAEADVL